MWMYQIHVSRKISDSTTGSEDDLSAQENVASDEPNDNVVNITCCNCGHVIKKFPSKPSEWQDGQKANLNLVNL